MILGGSAGASEYLSPGHPIVSLASIAGSLPATSADEPVQTRAKGSFATAGLRTRRQCATRLCSLAVIEKENKRGQIATRSRLLSFASTRMARGMIGKP